MRWAVFDMVRFGRGHSGIEVGFLGVFGRLATTEQRIFMLADGSMQMPPIEFLRKDDGNRESSARLNWASEP